MISLTDQKGLELSENIAIWSSLTITLFSLTRPLVSAISLFRIQLRSPVSVLRSREPCWILEKDLRVPSLTARMATSRPPDLATPAWLGTN